MSIADYSVVVAFFVVVLAIGFAASRRVNDSSDYFVAGGRIPWWLGGVSHHVSGHSGVVFIAYAAVAYQYGFTLYVWWAGSVVLACAVGARWFAPRWSRLRATLGVQSPTEYIALRYNMPTQQLMAWSGVLLKLFDVGAKWAALGSLLQGFTGLPFATGVWVSGGISLLYTTVGGLWADLYTDFLQFLVQFVAGVVLFVAVMNHLGGVESLLTIWDRLPVGHGQIFNGPYTPVFLIGYAAAAMLSYNGGTWNLAVRYLGAPSARSARNSALLSGSLYVVWPLLVFFPMWAAPVLLPNLADPSQAYILLAQKFLPSGFVGLVLASMFAATMAMTTSDMNTISAVLTRDIMPVTAPRWCATDEKQGLKQARIATLVFTFGTLIIGLEAEYFGGVLGLIVSWFAALIGPVSVPMLFGLLPLFRHAGPRTAIISILAGFGVFALVTYGIPTSQGARILSPVATSLVIFSIGAWLSRGTTPPAEVDKLLRAISNDIPEPSPTAK